MTGWPHLPWAYPWALRWAREAWVQAEMYGPAPLPPPVVLAVATVTGLPPEALWDHVEGLHGWEPHDAGYEQAVWAAAACDSTHGEAALSLAVGIGQVLSPQTAGPFTLDGDYLTGPWRYMGRRC